MDSFGKTIRTISSKQMQSAGKHNLVFDAAGLQAGMYYCKVQTDAYSVVKKVILSR
jgi:hypothetical protein